MSGKLSSKDIRKRIGHPVVDADGHYSDLIGHWKNRSRRALEEVNPANPDRKPMHELFERFGGKQLADRLDKNSIFDGLGATGTGNVKDLNDLSACGIGRPEDILELLTRNLYCGRG